MIQKMLILFSMKIKSMKFLLLWNWRSALPNRRQESMKDEPTKENAEKSFSDYIKTLVSKDNIKVRLCGP